DFLPADARQSVVCRCNHDRLYAFRFEQTADRRAHARLVRHDKYGATEVAPLISRRLRSLRRITVGISARDLNRNHGAFARSGTRTDRVVQHLSQTSDDRQAQSQPPTRRFGRTLIVLLKYMRKLILRDADAA